MEREKAFESAEVVPCKKNDVLNQQIIDFAEVLKTKAHTLGPVGLTEADFYEGVFRGAIERIRGQYAATMRGKRDFIRLVLNHMEDQKAIKEWAPAGESNRHDYRVILPDGLVSIVELKGCLDGNNTTIFERPTNAQEFIIWSVCTNPSADPRHNIWSGIHTRLSAEIIENEKHVDGLIAWDWLCGTIGRPCPKLAEDAARLTTVGQFQLTPPCIYLFPKTIPSVRNNPNPDPHTIGSVGLLNAIHKCFGGRDEEIHSVRFSVSHKGPELVRKTIIERNGKIQHSSEDTPIRRK